MRILELFKGTGSVSKVFADAGCEVVSLDIIPKFNPTHLCDILDFDYKQYQPKQFDIIWASPECKIFTTSDHYRGDSQVQNPRGT
jgi:site-specific DNA-cytosine methylase